MEPLLQRAADLRPARWAVEVETSIPCFLAQPDRGLRQERYRVPDVQHVLEPRRGGWCVRRRVQEHLYLRYTRVPVGK
jgi:hypothetical protein